MPNATTNTYNRTTGSVYHAQSNKPTKGRRDTSEVKVAALVAANYYREGKILAVACSMAGVYPGQVVGISGYFENVAEILRTPMNTIPDKRWGVDPGPVNLPKGASVPKPSTPKTTITSKTWIMTIPADTVDQRILEATMKALKVSYTESH